MKARHAASQGVMLLAVVLSLSCLTPANAGEYDAALQGVTTADAVFDFRIGAPPSALSHMQLVHQTYRELGDLKIKRAVVVIFIGPSVKLVSKNRDGFSAEDQKTLDALAATIAQMEKDGIRFELCGVAAQVFKVDTNSLLPQIKVVTNGWVSEIGYQARGYALVPAY